MSKENKTDRPVNQRAPSLVIKLKHPKFQNIRQHQAGQQNPQTPGVTVRE